MPVSGVIKLADANLWLTVAFSDHLHHAKAKAWFDMQSYGTCVASFALETQMQLVTFDQGFSRFAGLDLLVLSN